jgi:hypothetical protein
MGRHAAAGKRVASLANEIQQLIEAIVLVANHDAKLSMGITILSALRSPFSPSFPYHPWPKHEVAAFSSSIAVMRCSSMSWVLLTHILPCDALTLQTSHFDPLQGFFTYGCS